MRFFYGEGFKFSDRKLGGSDFWTRAKKVVFGRDSEFLIPKRHFVYTSSEFQTEMPLPMGAIGASGIAEFV